MKTQLEQLVDIGVIPNKKVKPFRDWKESTYKDLEIEIGLLDVGENLEVADIIGNLSILPQVVRSKIEILARAIIFINGKPPCTDEDLERYNRENKLEGQNKLNFLEYKKNVISKWSLVVLNRIHEEYTELLDDQVEFLTGVRPKRESDVSDQSTVVSGTS